MAVKRYVPGVDGEMIEDDSFPVSSLYVSATDHEAAIAALQAELKEARAEASDYDEDAANLTAQIKTEQKRITTLEAEKAALIECCQFYLRYDTREGHRKKCGRWRGLSCDCGGEKVEMAARTALQQSMPAKGGER